ncbi:hypothetical protein CFIICLFH_4416 [Methylobacterium goesingense]|nr:hypothetical protein CFIICLFH_4416 [Methylobacterium goesingense]
MVRVASPCAWNAPSRLAVMPWGRAVRARVSAMAAATAEPSAPAWVLAWTTSRRRPFSRRIWLGPSRSAMSASAWAGTQPLGVSMRSSRRAATERPDSGSRTVTS